MTKPPAIKVDNLIVQFGKDRVLNDVSFAIEAGQVVAVIGPNGSGKSTLIKTMLGLEKADQGNISFFGKPLSHARSSIGYVPQHFTFDKEFPITVSEFLGLRLIQTDAHIAHKLSQVGLRAEVADQHLGALSGGEMQRVLIAQAILNDPKILILDEANAGIDVGGEQNLLDIIRRLSEEHGTTVVMISHEIDIVAQFVDQVICLNRSLICHGTPKEILTEKTLKGLFGDHASVYEHQAPHHHHRPIKHKLSDHS